MAVRISFSSVTLDSVDIARPTPSDFYWSVGESDIDELSSVPKVELFSAESALSAAGKKDVFLLRTLSTANKETWD